MLLVSAPTWIGISLIVLLAFSLKAMTGFGENLLMVPLISFFLPLTQVLPITLVVVLVADLVLLVKLYKDVWWWYWRRMAAMAVIGVLLGGWGLANLTVALIEPLLGSLLILYALRAMLPLSHKFLREMGLVSHKPKAFTAYLAGLTGGGLSGLMGTGGPPVIAYLHWAGLSKAAFRATCVFTFLVFDLLRLVSYSWQGLFTEQTALTGISLLPAFAAGSLLGFRLHDAFPEQPFRRVVQGMLLVIGLTLVLR